MPIEQSKVDQFITLLLNEQKDLNLLLNTNESEKSQVLNDSKAIISMLSLLYNLNKPKVKKEENPKKKTNKY
jgi:hypothetical protein